MLDRVIEMLQNEKPSSARRKYLEELYYALMNEEYKEAQVLLIKLGLFNPSKYTK